MNTFVTIRLRDHFASPFLSNGNEAIVFRRQKVEPLMEGGASAILDLGGVDNMTDSFANACFAQLFAKHRDAFGKRLKFKACSPLIKGFVISALEMSQKPRS